MASRTQISSLARRSLFTCNVYVRVPTTRRAYSYFPPTRRRWCLLQQSRPNCPLMSKKSLSTTPRRRLADVNDSFDPREQDRESDEVDVCIVGGGMSCGTPRLKHINASQDLRASVQPSGSSRWPTKPEMKTSEFFFSRKQAS